MIGSLLAKIVDTPTFFLFEDVHWMDEASSELLRFLGLQVSTHPWLACTTRRPVAGGFVAAEGVPPVPAIHSGWSRSPRATRASSSRRRPAADPSRTRRRRR